MDEKYIKENKLRDLTEEESNEELLLSINFTKKMLDESHTNFEFAERRIN